MWALGPLRPEVTNLLQEAEEKTKMTREHAGILSADGKPYNL